MSRPISLTTGQFGDISLDDLCAIAKEMGYDALEIACHAHFDVKRAVSDETYVPLIKSTLKKHGLECYALSAHLIGQCVGDRYDSRLDNFAPSQLAGKPDEIRAWAIDEMKNLARAANKMGVKVVTFFLGSPIWAFWYSFPQTTAAMIDEGYKTIVDLWTPIFDVFDENDVKLAFEVHPSEIAFDYYSTVRLFKEFDNRPTLGLNYDPSHLLWQGVDEVLFLREMADKIYHVHMKDVQMTHDPLGSVLGSYLEFGDSHRGWNFVSMGHGDVDFDGIIRELNAANYDGPLSVEWEDSGMDRMFGAKESCDYVRNIDFDKSNVAFDAALKTD